MVPGEGCSILRRSWAQNPRRLGGNPQADGENRISSNHLALDEVLRALWPPGFHPVLRLQGGCHQRLFFEGKLIPRLHKHVYEML